MDVPIYKLDLHENSFSFDKNPSNKCKKSLLNHSAYKDSSDSNLFSQESQVNTSTASIDKNESFWQSLRNLWRKKDCENEVALANGNSLTHKMSTIMEILDELESHINNINTKVNSIKSIFNFYDKKVVQDILKSVQNLSKKSEKTKIQCTDIFSDMQILKDGINTNLADFQSIVESGELSLGVDELSNNLSSEILMKFQSILQNSLSELSADILMQWNDVLYNIYSGSPIKSKKKKNFKTLENRKSPGGLLVNSLRRSERLQNKNDPELNSFNKSEIMLIKKNRFQNISTKNNSTRKVLPGNSAKKSGINTQKSIPIKRSLEIFKYYEESQSDLVNNNTLEFTSKRSNVKIFKNDKNCDLVVNGKSGNSNYDSEADLISLRKLFNC